MHPVKTVLIQLRMPFISALPDENLSPKFDRLLQMDLRGHGSSHAGAQYVVCDSGILNSTGSLSL
jgi:hypothetical protein